MHLSRAVKELMIVEATLIAILLGLAIYSATLPPFFKDGMRQRFDILNIENTTTGDPAYGLPDLTILIKNVDRGNESIQFDKESCLYVDDILITGVMIDPPDGFLAAGEMATLMISGGGKDLGEEVTIEIVTITGYALKISTHIPYRQNSIMKIKSINWDESTNQIRALVEFNGIGTLTLEDVYANETLDAEAVIAARVLSHNQTTEIILSETYVTKPMRITVRIVTSDGFESDRTKIFYAITLSEVHWDERTSKISVVLKNSGDETVTLSEVYVNRTLDVLALPNPKILESNQEAEITLSGTFMDTHTPIPIRVMTLEGAVDERSSPIYGLWIQSINWNSNTGKIIAYVYSRGYEGAGEGRISYAYVNGTKDSSATIENRGNDFWAITLSKIYANNPQQLTLKVVTSEGAFGELTMRPPNEYYR